MIHKNIIKINSKSEIKCVTFLQNAHRQLYPVQVHKISLRWWHSADPVVIKPFQIFVPYCWGLRRRASAGPRCRIERRRRWRGPACPSWGRPDHKDPTRAGPAAAGARLGTRWRRSRARAGRAPDAVPAATRSCRSARRPRLKGRVVV